MTVNNVASLRAIYRYPVKGLTPEALDQADLEVGKTIPFDRAYALENGPGRFDPDAPSHLPKVNFLMLMRQDGLARLTANFDPETHHLTIAESGQLLADGCLNTKAGREEIETFFQTRFQQHVQGQVKLVQAPGHSFSDVKERCVHIINLASLRALEVAEGRGLSPLRFRPNLVIDGQEAWQEFNWLDRTVTIGTCQFKIFKRTERCAAIDVDPLTAQRDTHLATTLQDNLGHRDFGVYATVITPGRLTLKDDVAL